MVRRNTFGLDDVHAFFQLLLFAGYLYAHLISERFTPAKQMIIHILLMVTALLALPVTPNENLEADRPRRADAENYFPSDSQRGIAVLYIVFAGSIVTKMVQPHRKRKISVSPVCRLQRRFSAGVDFVSVCF